MTSHLLIFIVPDDQIWITQVQQMGHKTCSVVGLERWMGERWTASRVKSMVDQIRGRIVHNVQNVHNVENVHNVHNVHNAQEVHVAKSQARPPHIHTTHHTHQARTTQALVGRRHCSSAPEE